MISPRKMFNQKNLKMRTLISCLAMLVLIIGTTPIRTHATYLTINSAIQMSNSAEQHQQQQQLQQQQQQQLQQQQPPSIIPFSFNSNVQENQRAIVMCTTSSGENPVSFTWLKDGQLLSAAYAQARRITLKPDTDSSTLKISTVRLDHAGNYTCLAKNRFGSQMHSAQLVVHGEPRWLKEPQHEPLVTTQGQTVVIDCQTTGWPRPVQTWKYKTHLHGEFHTVSYAGGHYQLADNGSLIIRKADKSDEANYLCISSNGIGRGLSWSTSLKVTVPAHFETQDGAQPPQTTVIRKQSQVQLRCDALGDQPITIEWYKNKQPLAASASSASALHAHNGGSDSTSLLADARYSIHSNTNRLKNGLISQLLIRQAQRSDNAVYECVTRNQYGRDRQAHELIVQEEPEYIQELQMGPVNSRSVTLIWREPYDGRSPITSYMFQYKRIQDAYVPSASVPSLGLVSGDLETFGALDGDQLASPSGPARLSQASPLEGDWQHANRIVMPVVPATAANNLTLQSSTERAITIEKLEPSSKYIVRALALNSIGQSRFSPPMEFSTDEEAPEVGPVNIRAVAINSTSIAVSWDEIPRSKHLGRIHGYYIGYRAAINNTAATNFIYKPYVINDLVTPSTPPVIMATPSSGNDQNQNSAVSQQQQVAGSSQLRLETLIQDLRRDTVYEITVVAFNSRGTGPSSDFVVCKTIEMEAPKPVKLAIRRESNESIFVEWQRDPTDQNPVDDYVLYQEKNTASQEWLHVRLPGNQTHYKAPGLKCGTNYQFYIIAHNKVGKSQPSETVSASTSGAIPVVPSKHSLLKWVNSTCLLVNLNSFQGNGCRIHTFSVRYRVERQVAASTVEGSGGSGASGHIVSAASSTSGSVPASNQQAASAAGAAAAAAAAAAQSSSASANQLIGANGMSASHQALTMAGQLGGKAVLAGQTSNSAAAYASEWVAIRPKSNQKQQRASDEDRMEYLCDLSPVGEYTIHVSAANDVGRSEIEYTVLMSSDELRHSALKDLLEFMGGLSTVFAYIPSLLVFLLAALLLIIVCLILYTTAIKYYQKFVIMQNQMRATRRAKADEKRRRKLNNLTHGARNPTAAAGRDKSAELWADEFEEGTDMMGDGDEQLDQDDIEIIGGGGGGGGGGAISRHNCSSSQDSILDIDGDDEDETTATEELASSSSSSGNGRVRGRRAAKRHASTVSHSHRHNHLQRQHHMQQQQQRQQQQHHHQFHLKQHSNPLIQAQFAKHQGHYHTHAQQQQPLYGTAARHQYLSNIANSAFGDTSSIDTSPCNGKGKFNGNGSICMSTASNESIHGRFQCLNSKQYVKMNEYTMLPSISASLAQQQPSDLYGTAPGPVSHAHHQVYRPLTGSSPSGQSSASNTTTTANASQSGGQGVVGAGGSGQPSAATNYSTLRRTNMQTYLPRSQQQQAAAQQQQQRLARRPSQNLNDIYGYYMAPPAQAQAAAVVAQAAAAQQAANEAANSIFVPPQQIIYSAPNIRRQPPVFL